MVASAGLASIAGVIAGAVSIAGVMAGAVSMAGVIVAAGVMVVVVVVVSTAVSAGVGETASPAGALTSVFCSHAAKSAALARIQIYFFIGNG